MRRGAGKTRRMVVLKQKTKKEREEGRKKRVFLVGGGGENIIHRMELRASVYRIFNPSPMDIHISEVDNELLDTCMHC